ncbi:UNKNOWN [Stylonychia lemnae]|uniref:Uncharacterized protein n=1 Tax=Stylonychia lemnae TaxID=5949 RepID=A0A078B516_STYLE|nr:UNKNOWN [Stylonychia lemnae]|eukprot:CDW89514.1 UNKNOWN [Stylonychia lemnae]
MKVFEADQKRLKSILQTYEEKKSDLVEREKKERLDVISMTKDCFTLFKIEYNDQTSKFEKGILNNDVSINDMDNTVETNHNISRMNLNYQDNEKNETVSAFMMDDGRDIRMKHEKQHDFDGLINQIVLYRDFKSFIIGQEIRVN